MFSFHRCDLSYNGTTSQRGQIPSILYYSSPLKSESINGKIRTEIHARDTALKISSDITKKCTDLLILARNALATSVTPSEKSGNSSNNTQTIDSEQNITPIEEHVDITFTHNTHTNNTPTEATSKNISTARDITKRLESFSKGIFETLKFDKRSTNPFEYEIEIGSTEIHPKDLIKENDIVKTDQMSKINGNNGSNHVLRDLGFSKLEEERMETYEEKILNIFEHKTSSMFHTLLPLTFGHIAALANSDPRGSVEVLTLIREILPHVSALNKINSEKMTIFGKLSSQIKAEVNDEVDDTNVCNDQIDEANAATLIASKMNTSDLNTTSNHYCIVESDHPYKPASINNYK